MNYVKVRYVALVRAANKSNIFVLRNLALTVLCKHFKKSKCGTLSSLHCLSTLKKKNIVSISSLFYLFSTFKPSCVDDDFPLGLRQCPSLPPLLKLKTSWTFTGSNVNICDSIFTLKPVPRCWHIKGVPIELKCWLAFFFLFGF